MGCLRSKAVAHMRREMDRLKGDPLARYFTHVQRRPIHKGFLLGGKGPSGS